MQTNKIKALIVFLLKTTTGHSHAIISQAPSQQDQQILCKLFLLFLQFKEEGYTGTLI